MSSNQPMSTSCASTITCMTAPNVTNASFSSDVKGAN